MSAYSEHERYKRLLVELGPDKIDAIDREEGGLRWGISTGEYEQSDGAFTFGAMSLDDQAALLRAIAESFPGRTVRPNKRTPSSYGLKHLIENYLGFYVSNLQCKTAFHILGYRRSYHQLNPIFNIRKHDLEKFRRKVDETKEQRRAVRRRVEQQQDAKKCARYLTNLYS